MDKILEILEKEGLTSLEFDLTVSPELYVRTRIERGGNRGRAYYFVRSGDTAERGEGACPDEAFAKKKKSWQMRRCRESLPPPAIALPSTTVGRQAR